MAAIVKKGFLFLFQRSSTYFAEILCGTLCDMVVFNFFKKKCEIMASNMAAIRAILKTDFLLSSQVKLCKTRFSKVLQLGDIWAFGPPVTAN